MAALETFCMAMQFPVRKNSPDEVQASANEIARLLRSGDTSAARREVDRFTMTKAPN